MLASYCLLCVLLCALHCRLQKLWESSQAQWAKQSASELKIEWTLVTEPYTFFWDSLYQRYIRWISQLFLLSSKILKNPPWSPLRSVSVCSSGLDIISHWSPPPQPSVQIWSYSLGIDFFEALFAEHSVKLFEHTHTCPLLIHYSVDTILVILYSIMFIQYQMAKY